MFRNYIKIAFRSLAASKAHSAINILGLGIGIACCLLITLFVRQEWTYDAFHHKAQRIYRVYARENWGENQQFFNTVTPFPMGAALQANFPEVESFVRLVKSNAKVKIGDQSFNESLTVADRSLLDVFDFELASGNPSGALREQSNVILSEPMALKYFGTSDPLNKVISIQVGDEYSDFTVTGVARVPSNSSIQFQLLISDQNLKKMYSDQALTSAWFNITPETYVLLKEGTSVPELERKFPSVFRTLVGEASFVQSRYAPGLQALTDIHLNTEYPVGIAPVSNPRYSYILGGIAALILLLACINFVTLSVGRSLKRSKEVGIRKVVGADRRQLITQFIGEAVVITLIAIIAGLGLAELGLPLFNDLSGKTLTLEPSLFTAQILTLLVLIIGLIAGSYPAFFLSGFKPIAILKGSSGEGDHKQTLRKVLVGAQLMLSVFLITCTLIMGNQFRYLRDKDLGFSKDQLVAVPLDDPGKGKLTDRVMKAFDQAQLFKSALKGSPGIADVCASSHDFGTGAWANIGFTDTNGTYRTFDFNSVDEEYLPTLQIKLMAGRNFSEKYPSDRTTAVIVNEAFAREYGWTDALGKKIPGKNFKDNEIIGVVRDFNFKSLYTRVSPLMLVMDPHLPMSGAENVSIDAFPIPKLLIRLQAGKTSEALDLLKSHWKSLTGGATFDFHFVDQTIAEQYQADQNLGKTVRIATLLTILIGSLGLYGLASLAMQNRATEISIRKVLGATERSLLVLLSSDYLKLMLICMIIAIPLTIFTMRQWLQTFQFRVPIGWSSFFFSGGISLFIAMAAISYHVLKTAWTRPVDALKQE